jgi:hypothetical protein
MHGTINVKFITTLWKWNNVKNWAEFACDSTDRDRKLPFYVTIT